MAVLKDAVSLQKKGYATMAKSSVVPFELPSEFSSDPSTEVIQAGARELPRAAVQAEVSAFIAEHAHLLDEEGRQRLVRHGFLPERGMMTGIGTVPVQVPRVRDRGPMRTARRPGFARRWFRRICTRRSRWRNCCPDRASGARCGGFVILDDHAAESQLAGRV